MGEVPSEVIHMKDRKYLNFILTVLTVVLTLNLMVTIAHGPDWSTRAMAKDKTEVPTLPDSGAQREEIIKQLKGLNEKAEALQKAVTSGELTVRVGSNKAQP